MKDRERYYYRSAYMDCARGVDFLCSRPELDMGRIGVWGFSQGGCLTLPTTALDHRFSAAVDGVPWLSHFPVTAEITTSPYVELHDCLAEHPARRETALANLADAIECPTLIGGAASDRVHPIRTVMPVFERIRSIKSIIVYPDLEHECRTDFTPHGNKWMDRYLR